MFLKIHGIKKSATKIVNLSKNQPANLSNRKDLLFIKERPQNVQTEFQNDPQMTPNDTQMSPKWPPNDPEDAQGAPKWSQVTPKGPQSTPNEQNWIQENNSKWSQNDPKIDPLQPANQPQITANHVICKASFFNAFGHVDLHWFAPDLRPANQSFGVHSGSNLGTFGGHTSKPVHT